MFLVGCLPFFFGGGVEEERRGKWGILVVSESTEDCMCMGFCLCVLCLVNELILPKGAQLVDWLMEYNELTDRDSAVKVGQLVHHISLNWAHCCS